MVILENADSFHYLYSNHLGQVSVSPVEKIHWELSLTIDGCFSNYYYLKDINIGFYLESDQYGLVRTSLRTSDPNQEWFINNDDEPSRGHIVNRATGKYLEVVGSEILTQDKNVDDSNNPRSVKWNFL